MTALGIKQAEDVRRFWNNARTEHNVPDPEVFYISPLTRCLETAQHSFPQLSTTEGFKPVVKESLREQFGVHTCDRRSSLCSISKRFPQYEIENDFTENDELWTPDHRETLGEAKGRVEGFLQYLFLNDKSTYISLTTHSGTLRALEASIGHPDVLTAVGAIVPFMIQGVNKVY